jgi:hypothetical protein
VRPAALPQSEVDCLSGYLKPYQKGFLSPGQALTVFNPSFKFFLLLKGPKKEGYYKNEYR